MIKVLATGIIENNFGYPSILHGLQEVLKELYGDDFKLIYYQTTPFNKDVLSDFDIKMRTVPFSLKALPYRSLTDETTKEFINDVKESDMIVDLKGICFRDDQYKNKFSLKQSLFSSISVLNSFRFLTVGKIFRKKTVKNTCSFGPMKKKTNRKSAAFACNHLFDVVSAREINSRNALIDDAKVDKGVLLSPDIANMMRFEKSESSQEEIIGVSVSHKINGKWDGEESYIDCIIGLCAHIDDKYKLPIIIIPNETSPLTDVDDVSISTTMQELLKERGVGVDILDSENMSSTELKNVIASCEVVVSSRYHSCVAALSSGVPTLVIGWHHKYDELLQLYGQEEWGISTEDCTEERLIRIFDSFWENRQISRNTVSEKFADVRKAVLTTSEELFSLKGE